MITIGTWNVENLFRPESGDLNKMAAYDAKLHALAKTITTLEVEVLAVQEVGEAEALTDLIQLLPGTWETALADPDGRGIRVGVMSRAPIAGAEQVMRFPVGLRPVQIDDDGTTLDRMGRPALHVQIELHGLTINVISCHLKSKLLTFPGGRFSPRDEHERTRHAVYALSRRAAEAAAVRAYVTDILAGPGPEPALIVAGDLNDEPQAATTQILHGPPGSEIGTPGHVRPDVGDGQRLWNLAPSIPEDQRFTRVYRGQGELIDHILVSHALLSAVTTVGTGPIHIPSTTDNPAEHHSESGSDHRPVMAELELDL